MLQIFFPKAFSQISSQTKLAYRQTRIRYYRSLQNIPRMTCIFEIKYWTITNITNNRLEHLITNVKYMCENYKSNTDRNCKSVIVIVAPKEKSRKFKTAVSITLMIIKIHY